MPFEGLNQSFSQQPSHKHTIGLSVLQVRVGYSVLDKLGFIVVAPSFAGRY
jgi:hypothetical protein